jgi:hypothetical protein
VRPRTHSSVASTYHHTRKHYPYRLNLTVSEGTRRQVPQQRRENLESHTRIRHINLLRTQQGSPETSLAILNLMSIQCMSYTITVEPRTSNTIRSRRRFDFQVVRLSS